MKVGGEGNFANSTIARWPPQHVPCHLFSQPPLTRPPSRVSRAGLRGDTAQAEFRKASRPHPRLRRLGRGEPDLTLQQARAMVEGEL